MRRLVIDTASRACSVALFDGVECVAACHEIIGRGHAERLVPMIAELPGKGIADVISVNVGPGSFTGIRVGISAAKALALAWNVNCEGYSSLALLASIGQSGAAAKQAVDVAIHGGHGEVFFQSFDIQVQPISDAVSLPPEDAARISKATHIVGDAAGALVDLRHSGIAVNAVSDARSWPEIVHLPALPPSAAYVRGPDAKLPKPQ